MFVDGKLYEYETEEDENGEESSDENSGDTGKNGEQDDSDEQVADESRTDDEDAIAPTSEELAVAIPVTRVHGITSVLTEPTSGLLPGVAALIGLHGYPPDQMHLGDVELTKLDFPSTGRRSPTDPRSAEKIEQEAEKALEQLNELWDRAERYTRIDSAVQGRPEERRQPN